jgi:hypothetical protein
LPLEALSPQSSGETRAVRNHAKVPVLPDAADDESRLSQGADHQPPGLPRSDGENDVAEGVPLYGQTRQAALDEFRRRSLPAGHGNDVQEGFGLLAESGGGEGARTEEGQEGGYTGGAKVNHLRKCNAEESKDIKDFKDGRDEKKSCP